MYTLQSTTDVSTQSSVPSFFFNVDSFSSAKIISYAQKNIIPTDVDIVHFIWRRKDSLPRKFSQNIRNNKDGPSLQKILQTSMCVDCFASCENVVPRFQTSSILPFFLHPLDWSLNPLKETLLQPVLKSFITAFTIIRGYKINQQDLRFYAWLHL